MKIWVNGDDDPYTGHEYRTNSVRMIHTESVMYRYMTEKITSGQT